MTEITIDVSPEELGVGDLKEYNIIQPSLFKKINEAYEAKNNEIKAGDWVSYPHGIRRVVSGGEYGADLGGDFNVWSFEKLTKLPDHLQKSLNEWMDSL